MKTKNNKKNRLQVVMIDDKVMEVDLDSFVKEPEEAKSERVAQIKKLLEGVSGAQVLTIHPIYGDVALGKFLSFNPFYKNPFTYVLTCESSAHGYTVFYLSRDGGYIQLMGRKDVRPEDLIRALNLSHLFQNVKCDHEKELLQ